MKTKLIKDIKISQMSALLESWELLVAEVEVEDWRWRWKADDGGWGGSGGIWTVEEIWWVVRLVEGIRVGLGCVDVDVALVAIVLVKVDETLVCNVEGELMVMVMVMGMVMVMVMVMVIGQVWLSSNVGVLDSGFRM